MPKKASVKKSESQTETKKATSKTISPFKDAKILEDEIRAFANKYKATVSVQSKRISEYFEMSCFNYIVKFYELKGYTVTVQNLNNDEYRYKCSTSGIQSNFSYFLASIDVEGVNTEFEIQHNLAVQSSHDSGIFMTPDISIVKKGLIITEEGHYDTKRRLSYISNDDLMSFCEAKQFNPFPELMFSFIGLVNELQKDIITNSPTAHVPVHIAPSLMISGKPNKQANKIKAGLEARYCINIIYDLFYSGVSTFSKKYVSNLRTAGNV